MHTQIPNSNTDSDLKPDPDPNPKPIPNPRPRGHCHRLAVTLTVNPNLTPVLTLTDTRETPFYGALNECLRSENREDIKPFLPWMKLALSGMYRLPLQNVTVYRGIHGNFMGISYIYIYIYIYAIS